MAANALTGIPVCAEATKQIRASRVGLHGGQQPRGDVSHVWSPCTASNDFLKQNGDKIFKIPHKGVTVSCSAVLEALSQWKSGWMVGK